MLKEEGKRLNKNLQDFFFLRKSTNQYENRENHSNDMLICIKILIYDKQTIRQDEKKNKTYITSIRVEELIIESSDYSLSLSCVLFVILSLV